MDLKHLAHGQIQANVITLYTTFPRVFGVLLKLKNGKLIKYLLPETHLTHAMPTMAKEIPIFMQMLQTLIASVPTGTETEIWYLGLHFSFVQDEHWVFSLDIAKLICLQNDTHDKKKNNLSEGSFILS